MYFLHQIEYLYAMKQMMWINGVCEYTETLYKPYTEGVRVWDLKYYDWTV